MVGVSAISGAQSAAFAQAYTEWSGETPAQAAYFYYDAMAVMALALEKAWHDAGAQPSGDQIRAALPAVSGPPGEKVRWDELARGLELVRAGTDVDYVGASGDVDFDDNGDVRLSRADFWTVRGGAVVRDAE
jgi:ABC-type branched-subunit amino acid transport system substrate-binding protein